MQILFFTYFFDLSRAILDHSNKKRPAQTSSLFLHYKSVLYASSLGFSEANFLMNATSFSAPSYGIAL